MPKGTCSIDGCDQPIKARGWCGKHYHRWKRHGDPLLITRLEPGGFMAWLRQTYEADPRDECILPNPPGRRPIRIDGRQVKAHAIVCEWEHGPRPAGMECAHSCGNGHLGCVNRLHLRWATPSENQADRIGHGTSNRGERSGLSRLTEDDVRAIRSDPRSHREIALVYGVHPNHIGRIIRRERWGWLD